MNKKLFISTVSTIVLMNGIALADATVTNWKDMLDEIKKGGTITLGNDIVIDTKYDQKYDTTNLYAIGKTLVAGTTLNGGGFTLSAPEYTQTGPYDWSTFRFIKNQYTGDNPLTIENITFDGGYIITSSEKGGAAIDNSDSKAKLGNITANFFNNYAEGRDSKSANMQGGAIQNGSGNSIGNITGDFKKNHVLSSNWGYGGAIYSGGYSSSTIGDIVGDFEENYVDKYDTGNTNSRGGAIYNEDGVIGVELGIQGNFLNNYAAGNGNSGVGQGGAIANDDGKILAITGDFEGNYVLGTGSNSNYDNGGGAIFNTGSGAIIGVDTFGITGDFVKNYAKNTGSADDGILSYGGAIYNSSGTINGIKGDFDQNYTFAQHYSYGGAIYNSNGTITSISGDFTGNYAQSTDGTAYGGAITNWNGTIGDIEGSFLNNHAEGGASSQGGAIYSYNKDITVVARDGNTSKFSGNYVQAGENVIHNAIYLAGETSTLYFKASNSGTIILDDEIESYANNGQWAKIDVSADDQNSRIEFNNAVKGFGELTAENITIGIGRSQYAKEDETYFDTVDFSMKGGALDMENDDIQEIHMNSFTATGNIGISFDADMENTVADKIVTTNGASGSFSISSINVLSDVLKGTSEFKLQIVESLSGDINIEFVNASDYVAYTNKYKYEFSDNKDGSLDVWATRNVIGLNGAVTDDESSDKSYSISGEGEDVVRDLGQLEGGSLFIQGNGNELDGDSFGGMITDEGQKVGLSDVKVVTGFDSANDGGFIKNSGTLTAENTSFAGNNSEGKGGAIWSDGTVNVVASDGKDHKFSGNTSVDGDNAIYMEGGELNLQVSSGSLTFDDTIDGSQYTLNIGGASDGGINFNNIVSGASKINIKGGNVNLAEDNLFDGNSINLEGGILHLDNGSFGVASFAELNGGNGQLHFDVNTVDKTSDIIKIGNLNGKINVIAVNIGGDDKDAVADREDNKIKFAEVSGENNGSFNILRVMNSAYRWNTLSEVGEAGTTDWLMDISNEVVPEVTAYVGLHTAGIEQTRDMLRNVEEKSFSGRYRIPTARRYGNYNVVPNLLNNVWVAPVYSSSRIKSPVDMDADVKGLEFGGDIQRDVRNRIGLFASFRSGDYDLDGSNDYWVSNSSSKIDMDSYVLGAYYRYVNNNWWFIGDIYGGMLKADIKTNDGVNASSDGYQFGGAATLGYDFWMQKDLSLSPLARLGYTMQSWDDVKDNYGKTAKYDTLSMFELELGAKLQKVWNNVSNSIVSAWVMPSLVQTVVSGSDVSVTDLQKVKTVDNGTLGRIAGGINYYFEKSWNVYGSASYTFGSDYNNKEILLGINYSF